jgi:glycosyltransferase 2 family protein
MENGRPLTEEKNERQAEAREKPSWRGWLKHSWFWLLIASILLSLAVPFVLGGLKQFDELKRLTAWAIFLLTGFALVSWLFNTLRTRLLMSALGQHISFLEAALTTISAEFAGVATPSSVGMPATYTFLFHNLGLDLGEAMGLVGVIMLTDLVYFGTVMTVAAIVQIFEGMQSLRLVGLLLAVIAGGTLFLILVILNFRRLYHFVSRQMGKFSWLASRRYRLARGTVHFLKAVRTLRKMSWLQLVALYFVTVGFWMPRYLVLFIAINLVGGSIPFSYLILVQGVLNLGGQVSPTPAGGGVVGAGYAAFLSPYLAREPLAFTLIVWRTYNFYWYLLVGGPIFLYKTGHAAQKLLTRKK